MLHCIALYIRRYNMLQAGDRVAVAVSGGADSVALLELLLRLRERLGITVAAAHFNHGLRGLESDEDQRFVNTLAAERGLECFLESGTLPAGANLEEAARRQRYAFFRRLVKSGRATKVTTAHTADDQAETVLGRLLRGSGTRGLAGIFPVRQGYVIRPLLGERRSELRAWAAGQGLRWREDASNLDPRFLRNRLRQELLPHLASQYNPGLVAVLSETAEMARGEEQFWETRMGELASRLLQPAPGPAPAWMSPASAPRWSGGWKLAVDDFAPLSVAEQRRLLREVFRRIRGHLRQMEFSHVEEARRLALESQSGREVLLPGCRVERVFGTLVFRTLETTGEAGRAVASATYEYSLEVPGVCTIPETGTRLSFRLVDLAQQAAGYNKVENLAALDAIQKPVTVRNWRPGDVFETPGGRKKLKAFFVERRIPREERLLWPVVTSRKELVWARGFPVARPFRWNPGSVSGILIKEEELADAAASRSPAQ